MNASQQRRGARPTCAVSTCYDDDDGDDELHRMHFHRVSINRALCGTLICGQGCCTHQHINTLFQQQLRTFWHQFQSEKSLGLLSTTGDLFCVGRTATDATFAAAAASVFGKNVGKCCWSSPFSLWPGPKSNWLLHWWSATDEAPPRNRDELLTTDVFLSTGAILENCVSSSMRILCVSRCFVWKIRDRENA